ncbi:MAG TPA: glycosyltransferase WbuB [Rhodospirillaceae bacterium]|nr:glycosyltransferase WbuB [Rhodospirillaceae bacterium]
MTARKHLLYLALEAPREGQASYAHIHEIVGGLQRRGWTVDLFVPSYSGHWKRPGLARRMMEYLCLQWRVMRAFEEGQSVYVRSHFLAFPASLWARLRAAPIVHEINGPYEDVAIAYAWARPLAGIIKWMWRKQFQWADRLITVTPQLADWVRDQGVATPVDVVPNGANTDLFHPDAPCDVDLPERYAVFFGGLARWQGIPTLLAAKQSPAWPSGVDLVIVGDGPERPVVEAAAAADPGIRDLGRQPYRVLPGIVARSICGLVPKNNLGDRTGTGLYPLKVFETLSCGVPAVVSDFPGQADLVRDNDCGLAVPAEDPDALARAVADLAADPASVKAMGARGRDAIVAAHSWDIRAGATQDVLMRLTDRVPGI